jgi:hypothetical protein
MKAVFKMSKGVKKKVQKKLAVKLRERKETLKEAAVNWQERK